MAGEITNGGLVTTRSNVSPRHRLEEGALADVEPRGGRACRDPVQARVEPGQPERARVDVGGDDVAGVRGEVQGLDAAPGAEVERAVDRFAHGHLGQRRGGGADPEHVVAADRVGGAVEAGRQVAGDPEVAAAGHLVGAVGADVDARRDLADRALQDAGRAQPVDEPGERRLGRGRGYGACSSQSRVSVSTGVPPRVARTPGVVSLRESAAWATGPSTRPPRRR